MPRVCAVLTVLCFCSTDAHHLLDFSDQVWHSNYFEHPYEQPSNLHIDRSPLCHLQKQPPNSQTSTFANSTCIL